jgi:hypothetical protein
MCISGVIQMKNKNRFMGLLASLALAWVAASAHAQGTSGCGRVSVR